METTKSKKGSVQVRRNKDLNTKLLFLTKATGITKEPEIVRMAITELFNKYQNEKQVEPAS